MQHPSQIQYHSTFSRFRLQDASNAFGYLARFLEVNNQTYNYSNDHLEEEDVVSRKKEIVCQIEVLIEYRRILAESSMN